MVWSVDESPYLQPFMDGTWPMAQPHVRSIYSRQLFDAAESSRLLHRVIANHPRRAKHRVFIGSTSASTVDPNVRDTDDLGIVDPFAGENLTDRLAEAGERGIFELTGLRAKLRSTTLLQILGYEAKGKFIRHADSHVFANGQWVHNTPDRKFSSICWLSSYRQEPRRFDEFNGGRIVFPSLLEGESRQPMSISPQAGQFVIFPSHPVYAHEVEPVVRGYRVALVSFWDTNG